MQPGELKPVLAALVLPPTGPLLLALLGLALSARRRTLGAGLAVLGIVLALALTTNAVALRLAHVLMPEVRAIAPQELARAQAIVVLGGGVRPAAPEYGSAQPAGPTLQRLRYGAWLARRTGKPLAFAGGVGWGAAAGTEAEGAVARRVLQEDYGLVPRWVDDRSRDTAQNAARMAQLLRPVQVHTIALVTDATHMPRAVIYFRRAGFEVLAAPTDLPGPRGRPVLEWLPSPEGFETGRELVREWLGRLVARLG